MGQHFLLSLAARALSIAKVMRLSDRGVENVFLSLRWPETNGKPICPRCGCPICYHCRRSTDRQSVVPYESRRPARLGRTRDVRRCIVCPAILFISARR
jgi:hypothetical protein